MFAAFVFLGLQATAQVKFGAKVGVNLSNQKVLGTNYKSKLGLTFGLVTDISFTKNLSLQSGLLYSNRGARTLHNGHYDNYVIQSIEIPLNVVYKIPAGKGKFIIGAGPNICYNVNAVEKEHEEEDRKVTIGNNNEELRPLDFGANFVTGYEINKNLFVQLNYNLGLSNLSNIQNDSRKSTMFGLTLGYFFGK